jgi:hypothetical protein
MTRIVVFFCIVKLHLSDIGIEHESRRTSRTHTEILLFFLCNSVCFRGYYRFSHFSLLTSHFSLLTSYFSLLTSHFSLLTFRLFQYLSVDSVDSVAMTHSAVSAAQPSLLIRNSAERAWAVRPSPWARMAAVRPSTLAPAAEHWIRLVRFWKSYTPRGEKNRAVRDVGSTWFGPAQ